MQNLLSITPKKKIYELLPKSIENSRIKGLEELDTSSALSETRKRFYKLTLDGSPDLHLSYGERLKDTYERLKAFNRQLPRYTCKPVFFSEGQNTTC